MPTFNQRSFAGGEIAPSLYARVDTVKYSTGVRTLRNFEVMRHGGAQNRPGTEYVVGLKSATDPVRLVPFIYNAAQTYIVQFGHQYLRLIQDGAPVTTMPGADTWLTATAYALADLVVLNSHTYYCTVAHTSGATTEPGVGANWQTVWYEFQSLGAAGDAYELSTPYAAADLAELQFAQSADVMTFVHPSYPVYELRRLGPLTWTFQPRSVSSSVPIPQNVVNDGSSNFAPVTISAISSANPAVFTATGHGLATNDVINLSMDIATFGFSKVKLAGTVTVLTANTFTFTASGSTPYVLPTPGFFIRGSLVKTGTIAAADYVTAWVVTAVDANGHESDPSLLTGTSEVPAPNKIVTLNWDTISGISRYNIYKKTGALFGFVGTADTELFQDNGITPDSSYTAPFPEDLFASTNNYPGVVGYYQQRLMFGRTINKPETVWASRTGDFTSFSKRDPLQDDDRVEFTLAGRQVNSVRHLLDLGKLIAFTEGGEYAVQGDSAGTLTPTEVGAKQYSYNGSSRLAPLVIGSNALYVQARGSIVRDLSFDIQVDGYKGNDLTIFAAHLVDDYTLVDWAFAQTPHSIVWAVRSDGALLGLTYVPEHQVWGWHRHDTDGLFKNVCVVPEGTEDAVYVVVERRQKDTSGVFQPAQAVERFATRRINDIRDAIFVDSSVSWDGRNTSATTMILTGGTLWDYTELLTLTASAATFTDNFGRTHDTFGVDDAGNAIHLTAADGSVLRCEIVNLIDATNVEVRLNRTAPADLRAATTTAWAKAIKTLSNLTHLAGKDISVFGDGFVVANPNNPDYTVVTVNHVVGEAGTATLDKPYAVLHAGLPYLSDLETLDIDTAQGETLADKKKNIGRVTIFTEKSRGLWAGASAPADDSVSAIEGLRELKIRNDEPYDSPVALRTEPVDVLIRPEWNSNGRVFLRNLDPIPLTILAVAPSGSVQTRG